MFENLKVFFGRRNLVDSVTKAHAINSSFVTEIIESTDFRNKHIFEVCEMLYNAEPDIGGGVDRLATLVSESYRGFTLKDYDKDNPSDVKCKKLIDVINKDLKLQFLIESIVEGLLVYGNVLMDKKTLEIFPITRCTIIHRDEKTMIGKTIINPEIVCVDETGLSLESLCERHNYEDVFHIKYKDTSMFFKDRLDRLTYGIWSISPIQRLKYPTWWKRQSMIIDVLSRWKMIPREHHIINGDSVRFDSFSGNEEERTAAAEAKAKSIIDTYNYSIESLMPDQGYTTFDNVEIKELAPKVSYMAVNNLIKQLDERVWQSLNIPESVVSGNQSGTFASELVTSSFIGSKVSSLMDRIAPILEEIVKEKIKIINKSLPYSRIIVDYGYELEANRIDKVRSASVMAEMGVFTEEEIRKAAGFEPKREGEAYKTKTDKSSEQVKRDVEAGNSPDTPVTSHSDEKQRGGKI